MGKLKSVKKFDLNSAYNFAKSSNQIFLLSLMSAIDWHQFLIIQRIKKFSSFLTKGGILTQNCGQNSFFVLTSNYTPI